jgi:hypothetical protein
LNIPQEPLELSAPLARRLAAQLCHKDPVTGLDCSWNHGFWQYLRLMELAVTPAHQADFYHRAFQSITGRSGMPRILISGTTDYSMLAHVLAIYRKRGLEPVMTVVDICETSLLLNRWYAERVSATVACSRSDILEYDSEASFDAVCTDSFLGQFSPDERSHLLTKWHQLLRPDGTVITVTRVRATADTAQIGFSPEQAQAFRAAILREAGSIPALRNEDPAEIARAADLYLKKQRTWPIRSREEVQQLFERCGFRVDELSNTPETTTIRKAASPGRGEQVRIIATRL